MRFSLNLTVALRKESVDRNMFESNAPTPTVVALRKESVDRNKVAKCRKTIKQVALRKESVDRNFACVGVGNTDFGSLSARRAWIEMSLVNMRSTLSPGRSPQGERG